MRRVFPSAEVDDSFKKGDDPVPASLRLLDPTSIHCCWPHILWPGENWQIIRARKTIKYYVLLFDMEVDSASGSPEKSSSGWTCVGNSRITSAHDCGFFMSFFDDLKCVCKQLYIITWLEARGTEPHFSPNYNSLLSYSTHKCQLIDLKTRK